MAKILSAVGSINSLQTIACFCRRYIYREAWVPDLPLPFQFFIDTTKASTSEAMASHLRAASLPSSPRSKNEPEVDQQLQSLKTATASSSATIDTMCDGLRRLGSLYSGVEEMLLCAPSNRASLCRHQPLQRKAVEEELEQSLVLLDLCSATQESFIELRMAVQELLLAARRGDGAVAQLRAYFQITKKAHRQFKKVCCSRKSTSGEKGCRAVELLAEARSVAASVLQRTSCLLSKQIDEMPRRSLVSRTFQKGRVVACDEEQLRALECGIRDLESAAELLFRRLIQCRVSLLNALSS